MKSKLKKFSDFLYSQYDVVKDKIKHESAGPRYIDKKLINQGSQKKIYKVYDTHCSREIAMAVLINDSEEEKAQFLREAKITAFLQHPNIMPVYETGEEEGSLYFTMQLWKGESLQDILADSSISQQEKLNIFLKVCDALIYAHSKGIIHRDLKPDNVYAGQFGEVLLCDWGLANIVYADCDESLLDDESLSEVDLKVSLKGYVKGTPGYISPEILESSDYSEQSDIFALGSLLHKLLTGKIPFKGQTVEEVLTLTKNKESSFFEENADQVNGSLQAVCRKALCFDKSERYQKVKDLSDDLKSYLNGFSPKAEDASFLTQVKLFYKRNLLACNLVILFMLSLMIVVSIFISSIQQKEHEAQLLLKQLQESDKKRKKAEADLTPVYMAKAKDAFLNGKAETALALSQIVYNFDRTNKAVYDIYGKSLMSLQMFSEAADFLKEVNPELAQISIEFAKIKTAEKMTLNQLIKFLRAVGVKPDNDRAYIYRNILYEEFSKVDPISKLTLLEAVLKMRNNLEEMNSFMSYEDDAYIIDLSNNPGLKNLNVLAKFGSAVVKKMDLSNSQITHMYEVHNLNIIELHLRNTGKMNLSHFSHYYEYLDAEGSKNDFSNYLENKPLKYLNIHKAPFEKIEVLKTLKNLKTLIVSKNQLPVSVRNQLPKECKIIEK